jgi:hypothetical protein
MTHRLACLIAFTTGAAALACCQTSGPAVASMADYGLYYSENPDEGAKLAYGLANSDELSLMLQCRKGSGSVQVFELYGAPKSGPLSLVSGGHALMLNGKAERQDGPGDGAVTAMAEASSPTFAAFKTTGKMQVSGAGYRYQVEAKSDDRGEVGRFFAACGTV